MVWRKQKRYHTLWFVPCCGGRWLPGRAHPTSQGMLFLICFSQINVDMDYANGWFGAPVDQWLLHVFQAFLQKGQECTRNLQSCGMVALLHAILQRFSSKMMAGSYTPEGQEHYPFSLDQCYHVKGTAKKSVSQCCTYLRVLEVWLIMCH